MKFDGMKNFKLQPKMTRKILTFKEIGSRSYELLKETEFTTNHYIREYIHRKFPNVPITRIVIFGKVAAMVVSTGIAYHSLQRS